MTSEERREARYQRRVAKRAARKNASCAEFDDFEKVFSYEHLYRSYKMCRRNVAWKSSVQKYITQAPLMVNQTYERLQKGKWKSSGFYEFDINERGKLRHIKSVTIGERVVQRCLCDYALVPMLGRTFIYDNAASLQYKGYHFAIRRLCQHLREHYRKHGNSGYVLVFDFKKLLRKIPKQSITRERRKLKKFVPLLEAGIMKYEDVYTSFQSWRAYANNFSAWHTIKNIGKLYDELFIKPWMLGAYEQ